jgi:hypothetical protein
MNAGIMRVVVTSPTTATNALMPLFGPEIVADLPQGLGRHQGYKIVGAHRAAAYAKNPFYLPPQTPLQG